MLGYPERRGLVWAMLLWIPWIVLGHGCRSDSDPVRWGKQNQYRADEIIPIKLGRHGFPLVPGKINAKDVDVFFDTGNFFGFQIAPGVAQTLRLTPSGNERKSFASDGSYRYSLKGYRAESFSVFRTVFKDAEMFAMTDDAFEACVGLPELVEGRFTLDYQNRLMGISRRPFEKKGIGIDEFPLIWNESLRGMIVIEGRVNGVETLLQIDTGKSRTTIDEGLIALAGLEKNDSPFQQGYRVESITLGTKRFSVERAKVANFKAISQGYPGPILVGIGADILSRIVLTVDYTQKKVYLMTSRVKGKT